MLSRKALETIRELLNAASLPVGSKTYRFYELSKELDVAFSYLDEVEEKRRQAALDLDEPMGIDGRDE